MINLNSENVLFVNHYGECDVSNINQIFCCVVILTYFAAKCQGIYNKNHLQNLCITHICFCQTCLFITAAAMFRYVAKITQRRYGIFSTVAGSDTLRKLAIIKIISTSSNIITPAAPQSSSNRKKTMLQEKFTASCAAYIQSARFLASSLPSDE